MTTSESERLKKRMEERSADMERRKLERALMTGEGFPAQEEPKPTRRVIQIHSYSNVLFALCDDGSIWGNTGHGITAWYEVQAIPQS